MLNADWASTPGNGDTRDPVVPGRLSYRYAPDRSLPSPHQTANMRIAFITPHLSDNSLGRTYCLWLLARAHAWTTVVFAPEPSEVWGPLRDSDFARDCYSPDRQTLASLGREFDLLIGIKATPVGTPWFDELRRASNLPGFIDVDEPDLAFHLARSWHRKLRDEVLRGDYARSVRATRRIARDRTGTVSNPTLIETGEETVLPHVRLDSGAGNPHTTNEPLVAFIGTNKPHKGIPLLRAAVAALSGDGFRLVITDAPPADAKPWEDWLGRTSLSEGIELVKRCDIVVTPSLPDFFANGQLPAKIVDGMLAGRAMVVTDLPPLQWAVGEAGIVVPPGSIKALRNALGVLQSPTRRAELGNAARELALHRYTVDAQQTAFAQVCERWVAGDVGPPHPPARKGRRWHLYRS